jgi:hypothetical protein
MFLSLSCDWLELGGLSLSGTEDIIFVYIWIDKPGEDSS